MRNRIELAREIVKRSQWQEVEGQVWDLFSASHYVKVHDSLSPGNQRRLEAMPLPMAMELVWRVLARGAEGGVNTERLGG